MTKITQGEEIEVVQQALIVARNYFSFFEDSFLDVERKLLENLDIIFLVFLRIL